MSGSRQVTPGSAKGRRTPSAKRPATATSVLGNSKASLLFVGKTGVQLDMLSNFREVITKRINEDIARMVWIKILLVGPEHAGKTSLIRLFCEEKFHAAYHPTVGIDYGFKIHTIYNEVFGQVDVRVNFWDTAGRDEYLQIRNELYAETDVCLLVADVSMNPRDQIPTLTTFMNEVDRYSRKPKNSKHHGLADDDADEADEWDEDYEASKNAEVVKINRRKRPFMLAVCANKYDLLSIGKGDEDPSLKEIRQFAESNDLRYYQASCAVLDKPLVDQMFTDLIRMAAVRKLQKAQSEEFRATGTLQLVPPI